MRASSFTFFSFSLPHWARVALAHSLGKNDVLVSVPVEDPVDRAHRKRKLGGQMRVGPRKIGFWSDSRGGKGISSKHAHEVAADFLKNKVRLDRYDPVQLLEVPEPLLENSNEEIKRGVTPTRRCRRIVTR